MKPIHVTQEQFDSLLELMNWVANMPSTVYDSFSESFNTVVDDTIDEILEYAHHNEDEGIYYSNVDVTDGKIYVEYNNDDDEPVRREVLVKE